VTPPNAAEIVTGVDVLTADVVTVKLAVVEPAGTVTLAGVEAAGELSESDTAAPPAGAAALNVTVPAEELPPTTLVGFNDSADNVTDAGGGGGGGGGGGAEPDGFTVSVAERVTPLKDAVSVTCVGCATANVLIRKSWKVPP